jgi:hypothetical protein
MPATKLGPHDILSPIGTGDMGAVSVVAIPAWVVLSP